MYRDPVTGDELSRLEYIVRKIQVLVRTPWFIVAFNVITLLMIFILGMPLQWNDLASWLAIIIEWLVGTYMFGQTGRDAVHIRKIAKLEELNEHMTELNYTEIKYLEAILEAAGLNVPSNGQDRLHREDSEAPERRADPTPPNAG